MRKVLCICVAAGLIFTLAACADDGKITLASPSPTASPSASASAQTSVDKAAGVPSVPVATASPQVAGSPQAQQSPGPIIAESSNTVSDKEKETILDELSEELDSAFGGVESLEELYDSDLDTSNIE